MLETDKHGQGESDRGKRRSHMKLEQLRKTIPGRSDFACFSRQVRYELTHEYLVIGGSRAGASALKLCRLT
jgi:hypothetical protein